MKTLEHRGNDILEDESVEFKNNKEKQNVLFIDARRGRNIINHAWKLPSGK